MGWGGTRLGCLTSPVFPVHGYAFITQTIRYSDLWIYLGYDLVCKKVKNQKTRTNVSNLYLSRWSCNYWDTGSAKRLSWKSISSDAEIYVLRSGCGRRCFEIKIRNFQNCKRKDGQSGASEAFPAAADYANCFSQKLSSNYFFPQPPASWILQF